jgi:hypothetical protein
VYARLTRKVSMQQGKATAQGGLDGCKVGGTPCHVPSRKSIDLRGPQKSPGWNEDAYRKQDMIATGPPTR